MEALMTHPILFFPIGMFATFIVVLGILTYTDW